MDLLIAVCGVAAEGEGFAECIAIAKLSVD